MAYPHRPIPDVISDGLPDWAILFTPSLLYPTCLYIYYNPHQQERSSKSETKKTLLPSSFILNIVLAISLSRMGQRHNRRRTRQRCRNRSSRVDSSDSSPPSTNFFGSNVPSTYCVSKSRAACSSLDRFPIPFAQTWHHGYLGGQVRERKSLLEAEQYRLFGGEPGDDVDLCYRMLEYFGGLDYIDPPHSLKLLPG
ncbi:hypothetical protein V6Z90_003032 [Aspergillus fumigatus]